MATIAVVATLSCTPQKSSRWSAERANKWYAEREWPSGCDYIPSTAINQIEMWQTATFDPQTIDRELAVAELLGFNTMRVYLSSVVWSIEPEGLKTNMNRFLEIACSHGITPLFVLFDDCWNPESAYGQQPAPRKGIHNSGWVRDPSDLVRQDTTAMFAALEPYVKDILTSFANDERILLWDLYNEPGNSGYGARSLPLLRRTFEWAREVNPSQPLTAGVWYFECPELNLFQLENSDIISYHCYSRKDVHNVWIKMLQLYGRPLICTEYMARTRESTFKEIMPLLAANNVGAINWGFVKGKTNTIFAWGTPMPDKDEPEVWFHDIIRPDGTPFDQAETDLIKTTNSRHRQ